MKPSYFANRATAIREANRRTRATEQQHACYFSTGWVVLNLVTREMFDGTGAIIP